MHRSARFAVLAAAAACLAAAAPRASMATVQHAAPAYVGGYPQEGWETPPPDLHGAEQQGYHDGIEGARKDAGNHREPNVQNRDEYRHPRVPEHDRDAYREGFRRGYDVGVEHLMHSGTQHR